MKTIYERDGTTWIQISKEEYETNKDNKDFAIVFDQDTGKGHYYKKDSSMPNLFKNEDFVKKLKNAMKQ